MRKTRRLYWPKPFCLCRSKRLDWVSFIPTPQPASWVAGLCNAHLTIENQDYSFDNLRVTIATIEEQGKLKIAHMHASFPDLRNPTGNSFPVQA